MVYQFFHVLRNSEDLMTSDIIQDAGIRLGVTKEAALDLLVLGLGNMVVINGTTKAETMAKDVGDITKVHSNPDLTGFLGGVEVDFRAPSFEHMPCLLDVSDDGSFCV